MPHQTLQYLKIRIRKLQLWTTKKESLHCVRKREIITVTLSARLPATIVALNVWKACLLRIFETKCEESEGNSWKFNCQCRNKSIPIQCRWNFWLSVLCHTYIASNRREFGIYHLYNGLSMHLAEYWQSSLAITVEAS